MPLWSGVVLCILVTGAVGFAVTAGLIAFILHELDKMDKRE